jgi:DnaJ-class molecular chaperone
MTPTDLLAQLKAIEELRKRGYTEQDCTRCKGCGRVSLKFGIKCPDCHGNGYVWVGKDGTRL